MLIPNSILFMSAFEVMYQGWGFALSVELFRSFFKLFKANNSFLSFCSRSGLIIFTGHKNSIKHRVEYFIIVGAKGNFDWGLDLELRMRGCWLFLQYFSLFFFKWEKLYFARITSLPDKYDVFKCLGIRPGEDAYSAGTMQFSKFFLVFLDLAF